MDEEQIEENENVYVYHKNQIGKFNTNFDSQELQPLNELNEEGRGVNLGVEDPFFLLRDSTSNMIALNQLDTPMFDNGSDNNDSLRNTMKIDSR